MVENKYKHAPTIMLSRNGDEAGEIRNLQSYRCPMEGCTGWRICVKWPDGRHTFGVDDEEYFSGGRYCPNRHVYRTMLNEFAERGYFG